MQTQIACPQCRTPLVANVHPVVDVGQQPELKQMLLAGALNVAYCQKCGWSGQLAAPLVYHDAAHDLLMVYVPMELNLPHLEQQQLIGQMVRRVVDRTPAEQRRAYMLQPQQIFRWQTFLEKVLETEGITPEMIARQREQMDLLNQMTTVDDAALTGLIQTHLDKIDETFLQMLQSALETVSQGNQQRELVTLTNLQARLMAETPAGQRQLKQHVALSRLQQEARADGLSPALLLKHLLLHKDNEGVWKALATAASGGLSYEFFSLLSQEVERAARAKDKLLVEQLTTMRTELLAFYDAMRAESERIFKEATKTLQTLLTAPDRRAAVYENLEAIDDTFMQLLGHAMDQAERNGHTDEFDALEELEAIIMETLQAQLPPQVRLLNSLIVAPDDGTMRRLLDENAQLVNQEFLQAVRRLVTETEQRPEVRDRLRQVEAMVAMRV